MRVVLTAVSVVQQVRVLLCEKGFQERHRINEKAFTRQRKLRFDVVMLLVLQKSLKSLQLHLHDFFEMLSGAAKTAVTPGAWTQARAKLRHTAFIELNQIAVVNAFYGIPESVDLWRNHRLLAIDSSTLRLPDSDDIFECFGGQESSNGSGSCGLRVPQARLSVLYDLRNRIGIDARICKFRKGEVELAADHLSALRAGDVVVVDRGYAGYLFLARIVMCGGHFIVRCNKQSFGAAKDLFRGDRDAASITVRLAAKSRLAEAKAAGLPTEIQVRFISLRLPNGELEVLATSLLDTVLYPTEEFLVVYNDRWGIETYYNVLKGRLDLENFSGLTVEAILQDIHGAVFLSNLESVVTRDAAAQLPQAGDNGRLYAAKPNKAVTFHALKSRVIDLLIGKDPPETVLAELTELFLANPVSIRPARKSPRNTPKPLRSLNFQKRVRKVVF
jgi:hypothetical protein